MVEPEDVPGHLPGVLVLGAAMWMDESAVAAPEGPVTDGPEDSDVYEEDGEREGA